MGAPKALLEWHGSTLVRRVAGIVARQVDGPVLVVRARGQSLPHLPSSCEVVDDFVEGRGPLAGLGAGLEALVGRSEVAFACSTDMPFLHPVFVSRVLDALDASVDACVPRVGGFRQPLAGAYSVDLATRVRPLVASDRLKILDLLEGCRCKELNEQYLLEDKRLASWDPTLASVTSLNDQNHYNAARARPAPRVRVQLRTVENHAWSREITVRAATLAMAAEVAKLPFTKRLIISLNGKPGEHSDPEEPLAEGDLVSAQLGEDS